MVFIFVFSKAAGVSAPTDPSGDKMSLDQAIGDMGASVAQAREMLAKSTSTLAAVHREVRPHNQMLANADGFLNVLGPGTSTIGEFCSCPHGTWL